MLNEKIQIINFETAKLANKHGFFINLATEFYDDKGNDFNITMNIIPERKDFKLYQKASQTYISKWLRENHELYVNAYPTAYGYLWEILKTDGTKIKDGQYKGPNEGGAWEKYEDALEAGLQEAIKMI